MRLFIAADLPQNIIEALQNDLGELRMCIPGRPVRPDSFHITLAFLGETSSSLVPRICDALEQACAKIFPFPIALGSYGRFGKKANVTLWRGIEDDGGLEHLAACVQQELDKQEIPFDRKRFKAHITMMRKVELGSTLPKASYAEAAPIQSVTLFQSILKPEGPTYIPLYTVYLKDPHLETAE